MSWYLNLLLSERQRMHCHCLLLKYLGFEADDVIASYAKKATQSGRQTIIVSSDKDLMQLVNDDVEMLDPMKQRRIGRDETIEKFGVGPEHVVDVQSLAGDSTDNVPGVPGIGVKTAAELINQFKSLDALLAGAETIKQPKRRQNLIEFAEMARISRQLVRLADDVDVPIALDELITPVRDLDKLVTFIQEQGFKSLLASLGAKPSSPGGGAGAIASAEGGAPQDILPPIIEATDYQLITDSAMLNGLKKPERKDLSLLIPKPQLYMLAERLLLAYHLRLPLVRHVIFRYAIKPPCKRQAIYYLCQMKCRLISR